nr:zinc finger, CCHC-type, retrotransposon Gag domain protein [Tanacetum cinerariifolium]
MVNTRTDADLSAAVQNVLQTLLPQIREEFRTSFGPSDSGGNPPSMVNTRTDAELLAAIQNALQTLLPQIRTEIHEEFRTSSGPSDSGGNPPPAEFKKLFFLQFFPQAEQERLKREYHSIRQTNIENSTEFMQCFLRLAGFLEAAAGTAKEQEKNFQWGLCRQKSGDRHQPTTQQSSHRNHGHNNDRYGSDRRGGGDNHRSSNNNYSGNNNKNSGNGRDQRNRGQQSNRSVNSSFQQSRGPSEGYSYPVCTTCGRRHPGECRRATGTCFKCGQTGHLQKDCKKNTAASTSG